MILKQYRGLLTRTLKYWMGNFSLEKFETRLCSRCIECVTCCNSWLHLITSFIIYVARGEILEIRSFLSLIDTQFCKIAGFIEECDSLLRRSCSERYSLITIGYKRFLKLTGLIIKIQFIRVDGVSVFYTMS